MAWSSPMTFVTATALTAAQMNTYLRDNLNETEIAKAKTPGALIVSTAANAVAERVPEDNRLTQIGTTTSTSYTDCNNSGAGVGPSVTCTTGDKALVIATCQAYNSTTNVWALMSWAVSGATTIAAADQWAVGVQKETSNKTFLQLSNMHLHTTSNSPLTAGVNTFTAKYRCTAGKAYFQVRRLQVIPF